MFKELLNFQDLSFYGNKIKTNRSIKIFVVFPKVKYIPFLLLPFIIHHLNPSIQKSQKQILGVTNGLPRVLQ